MTEQKTRLISAHQLFGNMAQLLEEGYEAEFTVTGNSMWPLLAHGRDRVVIKKQPPQKGDVVLYCPVEGKYLLHRINRLKNGRFRAAGDANCFHDGSFPESCVMGTVIRLCRKGKWMETNSLRLRLWSFWWNLLYPFRPALLWLLWKIAACKGGIVRDH